MSQFALKLLALFTMLADHAAKILISQGALTPWLGMELNNFVYTILVVIGRMAFPIFAWFVAEGCRKTNHPMRYLGRLAIFAVLSEIPFQLCFYQSLEFGCHNVLFTLLLAAGAILGARALQQCHIPAPLPQILTAVIAIALGWVLRTDYNAWGVALILGLYYMPTERGQMLWLGVWITLFQLVWHGWNGKAFLWLTEDMSVLVLQWIGAMFSVAFLATYRGERGRGWKWLFYVFYPVHLLLLYGAAQLL